jgi:hypothetical protein
MRKACIHPIEFSSKYIAGSAALVFPAPMNNRNSKLVFVGMPTVNGGMSEQTRVLWDRLDRPIGEYTFVKWKVTGCGLGRARNILVHHALKSEAATMIMIDGDIVADESHIERLLAHPQKIVGAIYPRKELAWPTRWVFNPGPRKDDNGLLEVVETGMGLIKIDISAIELIIDDHMCDAFLSDEPDDKLAVMADLFSDSVVNDHWLPDRGAFDRKLSEDYYFCWLARHCDIHVLVDLRCQVGHVGTVDFLEVARLIQAAKMGKQT